MGRGLSSGPRAVDLALVLGCMPSEWGTGSRRRSCMQGIGPYGRLRQEVQM